MFSCASHCCESEVDKDLPGVSVEPQPAIDESNFRDRQKDYFQKNLRPSANFTFDAEATGSEYVVVLDRSRNESLGINVSQNSQSHALPIMAVTGGLAMLWNQDHPDAKIVEGDEIVEINGARNDMSALLQRCRYDTVLRLTLRRCQ